MNYKERKLQSEEQNFERERHASHVDGNRRLAFETALREGGRIIERIIQPVLYQARELLHQATIETKVVSSCSGDNDIGADLVDAIDLWIGPLWLSGTSFLAAPASRTFEVTLDISGKMPETFVLRYDEVTPKRVQAICDQFVREEFPVA